MHGENTYWNWTDLDSSPSSAALDELPNLSEQYYSQRKQESSYPSMRNGLQVEGDLAHLWKN